MQFLTHRLLGDRKTKLLEQILGRNSAVRVVSTADIMNSGNILWGCFNVRCSIFGRPCNPEPQ